MFKWIKEILSYGTGRGYEEGSTVLPKVKGEDISEPVISFLKTVGENPKRFIVAEDYSWYTVSCASEIPNYKAYKIWDKKLDKGWYVRGSKYSISSYFVSHSTIEGFYPSYYEHAFFLTGDEKEYLIKEISSIMNYRIDRKAKLDKIREDRRIRNTRNKLKELYK